MFEMYNLVLDLNFFDNAIKPMLYCYGIIQYLNLVPHGLLSCYNYFFLVIIQTFQHSLWLYVISFEHKHQSIKCLFKNNFFTGAFQPKKERASIPQRAFKNK